MDCLSGSAIEARLLKLATFTDVKGQMTRLTLSASHRSAVTHLTGLFKAAGMTVTLDGAGTLVGRYEAANSGARTLLIGSHIDTVRNAGIYDGNLGVITGLAAIEALHAQGRRLPYAIELLAFGDEEGVRFPSTLTGSRAVAGRFDPASLQHKDADGISRYVALAEFGAPLDTIATCGRDPAQVLGYLEVHIEQGPVLEARGLPVGIVTAINGASRGSVTVLGTAGHAGTLPMHMRHDAVTAAARMILAVEDHADHSDDVVATAGTVETPGGAINVVAGKARFSLDVRSPVDAHRHAALDAVRHRIVDEIAPQRGVVATMEIGYDVPATPCDPRLSDVLARAVTRNGLAPLHLPSGAGHDGMAFNGVLPIGMLFVRCRGGISHNPAEYASPEDMGIAARILYDALLDLAATP